MKLVRKIIKCLSNKYVKNIGVISLGFLLLFPGVIFLVHGDFSKLFELTYIRGHGSFSIQFVGIAIGFLLVFYGIKGLVKRE